MTEPKGWPRSMGQVCDALIDTATAWTKVLWDGHGEEPEDENFALGRGRCRPSLYR